MGTLKTLTRRGFIVASVAVGGGVAFGAWRLHLANQNPLEDQGALNPWVVITQDQITLVAPRAEMGQGVSTTLAALLAEELDVELSDVTVIHGPSALAYYNAAIAGNAVGGPHWQSNAWQEWMAAQAGLLPKMVGLQVTGGSTSMADGYVRLRQAGASAREALKAAAAELWALPTQSLQTKSGKVIAPDGRILPYGDLAQRAAGMAMTAPDLRAPQMWRILGKSQPRVDQIAKATGTAVFACDIRLEGMRYASVKRNPHLGGKMLSYDAGALEGMQGIDKIVPLPDGLAVIAQSTWHALNALDQITFTWGPPPYPESTAEHDRGLTQALDGTPNSTLRDEGSIPSQKPTLQVDYTTPYLAHATMEPMSACALLQDGHLTLWAGSQTPGLAARNAAHALGLRTKDVTLHTTFLGGAFGRRAETDFTTIAALIAAAMPNTPIQTLWSREEDMTHDVYRPMARAHAKAWLQEGRILGIDLAIAAPSVTRQAIGRLADLPGLGPDRAIVEGAFDQPYDLPNAQVRGYMAKLDVPVGFWRSVGNSQNAFFHESLIDELAHAAQADPLDFRLAHISHAPSRAVIKAVADLSDWYGPRKAGIGRGIAFCHSFGTPVAQVIEVERIEGEITIPRAFIACDPGIALDPAIIEAQMIGGMVFGLSAAIMGEITFAEGKVQQSNFHDYDALRISAMPKTKVAILQSQHGIGGVGEPGTPPAAPALANAIFDLTGQRLRHLPLHHALPFRR